MIEKTILITGGTGGIGKQTALALAKMGAQVIVTGRSQAGGEAAVAELIQLSGNERINLLLGDLSAQTDIRSVAGQFKQEYGHLDVLINNAGLSEAQRRLTADGIEADFAVNVVAPFLLTQLLLDRLQASPAARVINLTGGQHPAAIELDNLQAERDFLGLTTYSHTKLIMMAVMYEFAQRLQGTKVMINVCYPGQASTNMTQSVSPEMLPGLMRLMWPLFKLATRSDGGKSAAKAARASVYLASSAEVAGVSGRYFSSAAKVLNWPSPVLDEAVRLRLWETLERLTAMR